MSSDTALAPLATADAATLTGQLVMSELHRGDVLAGRFRIEGVLGVGGFGVVYQARDLSLDIDVALKLLRPELARRPEAFDRFRQELLLARQVSSPHVVRIHDIAQHDGRWFISMDYVAGESLERRLERAPRLSVAEAVAITRGLLEGLQAAHQRDVIHRDLKPANILLDDAGRALITDFGVARSLSATGATQTGIIVGTPEYLSPEQALGRRVDARSDLYAVGLMLYEMLAGTLPFSGGTPAETVMQRLVRAPAPLANVRADLPAWLHAFSERLLATNPARRFASARDALRALETQRVPRAPLNRRALIRAALVAALMAGAALLLWQQRALFQTAAPLAVASIERIAVLPVSVAGGDAELAGIARALDEHAHAWLRNDAALGSVPRRRMQDALARLTPGLSDAALRRQLPEIAGAAGASELLLAGLRREANGLRLELSLWRAATGKTSGPVVIEAADGASLFARYTRDAAALLASAGLHPGSPPPLAAAAVAQFGDGLLALDRAAPEAASTALAQAAAVEPASALVFASLLDAQESARQDLPAQATRDLVAARFANDASPAVRELYARALIGKDASEAATAELAAAVQAYPNDAELTLRYADALAAAGAGAKALDVLQHYVLVDNQDARAWFALGRTAIQQGQADAAVSNYLTRALVLNRLRGDRAAEAETSNALGVGYERLGQLDAAGDQYTQAAAIREKLGDEEGLSKSLRNLAIVQAVRGDSKSADQTLDRVKRLLEKRNDRASLAELYNDRGVVAEEHGAYKDALAFYRQALALRQELNLTALVAESLNNVGFASYNLGDFDNALVFWQQALAQYRQIDDRSGALHIAESVGLLEIARGRFAAAREQLAAALQSAEDHQLPEEAAVAHTYLGQLDLYEGRYADALDAAQHASGIFARRADQRGQAEAALLQVDIALALGDPATAGRVLATLQPAQLSSEQRVAFLLASARRARSGGDVAQADAQLSAAASAAADPHSAAGIRVQLETIRSALSRSDMARAAKLLAGIRAETTRLGDVPLRLEWLELETAAALRGDNPAQAGTYYLQAVALLRSTGRWANAVTLHRLGARALAGKPAEAAAARTAAAALRSELLADVPEAARAPLQQQFAQRARDESGDDHDD